MLFIELMVTPESLEVASTGKLAAAKAQNPFSVEVALLGVAQEDTKTLWLNTASVGPSTSKSTLTPSAFTALGGKANIITEDIITNKAARDSFIFV